MKIIISGGGTGGHVYPGISIADIIMDRNPNADIMFIGTNSGIESTLVPRRGYAFKTIRVKGFRRKLSADTLITLTELVKGLTDARRTIKDFAPDLVIGTGGYVAGPVLFIASMMGIPTIIHEQNVLPGVTNRILGRFVDRIAISFEEAAKYFADKQKVRVTGNPIRKEILQKNRDSSITALGFSPEKPLVLVFGGSKGSSKLNSAVAELIIEVSGRSDCQLLHVAGEDHYDRFIEMTKQRGVDLQRLKHIDVVPYLHQMPEALAAADLVVTSAGAITLAEITAVGIPAILVPKSHATDNHQEYNARALEKKGAAIVIPENLLDGQRLSMQVIKLISDKKALYQMRKASKAIGRVDAAERIYAIIVELVKM